MGLPVFLGKLLGALQKRELPEKTDVMQLIAVSVVLPLTLWLLMWLCEQFAMMFGCYCPFCCKRKVRVSVSIYGSPRPYTVNSVADLREKIGEMRDRSLWRIDPRTGKPYELRDDSLLYQDDEITCMDDPNLSMETFDANGDGRIDEHEWRKVQQKYIEVSRQRDTLKNQMQHMRDDLRTAKKDASSLRRKSVVSRETNERLNKQIDEITQEHEGFKEIRDANSRLIADNGNLRDKAESLPRYKKLALVLGIMTISLGGLMVQKEQRHNEVTLQLSKGTHPRIKEEREKAAASASRGMKTSHNDDLRKAVADNDKIWQVKNRGLQDSLDNKTCREVGDIEPDADTLKLIQGLLAIDNAKPGRDHILATVDDNPETGQIKRVSLQPRAGVKCDAYTANVRMRVQCGDSIKDP